MKRALGISLIAFVLAMLTPHGARAQATFSTYGMGCSGGGAGITLNNVGGSRPIIGTTLMMEVGNIPAGVTFGSVLYSFTQINPGADLTIIGMAGCELYVGTAITAPLFVTGATTPTSFVIENDPGIIGMSVFVQAALIGVPDVAPLNVGLSNGVALFADSF